LLKLVEMKLLLLIVDEIMRLCFDWCYVVMLMIIYTFGVAIGEVMIKLLFYWVLKKMGHKWWIVILDDLRWIVDVVLWDDLVELLFLVISFACERFWEETWVFIWKANLSDFGKQMVISDFE